MSRTAWRFVRLGTAVAVLAVIAIRLGTGPFVRGLESVDGRSLTAAAAIAAVSTACCAWRWCLVARGLGVPLPFRSAVAAYYRSQFLNSALPGGVVGDIHRGISHGRDAGDLGRGLRAVAWERTAGQAVQVVAAVLVLVALSSPVRAAMPVVLCCAAVCLVAAVLSVRAAARSGSSRWGRAARAVLADLRDGVAARTQWPGVAGASVVVVAGHAATFLIAARAAGVSAPFTVLLPITMLVLLGATVPTNLGGWGPREGVAAWAFASAGLGGAHGVAAATAYGVLAAVATVPGAIVLIAGWLGHPSHPAAPSRHPQQEPAMAAARSGHG